MRKPFYLFPLIVLIFTSVSFLSGGQERKTLPQEKTVPVSTAETTLDLPHTAAAGSLQGPDQESKSNAEEVLDYTKKVRSIIDAIGDLSPDDYFSKIDEYRDEVERFMETKRLVCNGDFSSVVLTGNGQGTIGMAKEKLTKEERSLCLNEAKALQVTYINNRYKSRKRYLDELHKQRIDELARIREESIQNLQRDFSE